MASIEKRGNSFRIKVSCGYKADGSQVTQRMTWTPEPDMTPKQIEKELQRQDMLADNPCRRVVVPKGSKKKRTILTIAQTEKFMALLRTAPLKYRAFFTLDIYSGMRRGEMLGLEWRDIDFETGLIHVERASNYTKANGIYTDTPKTESSVRFIKVPMEVIDVLKLYKAEQDAEREKVGDKWQEYDRLFVKWNGRPMNIGRSQRTLSARPNGLFTEYMLTADTAANSHRNPAAVNYYNFSENKRLHAIFSV